MYFNDKLDTNYVHIGVVKCKTLKNDLNEYL